MTTIIEDIKSIEDSLRNKPTKGEWFVATAFPYRVIAPSGDPDNQRMICNDPQTRHEDAWWMITATPDRIARLIACVKDMREALEFYTIAALDNRGIDRGQFATEVISKYFGEEEQWQENHDGSISIKNENQAQ